MTTIHSVNEQDSSRIDQMSSASSTAIHDYAEHQNNGPSENGYGTERNNNQRLHSSQGSFGQGNGSDHNSSNGSKAEDERKLFVGKLPFLIRERMGVVFLLFRWFNLGYNTR